MALATGQRTHYHNIWSRNIFPFSMEGCVLYLPLWQEDMQGSTLLSYDQYHHSCAVTGTLWTLQGRTFDGSDDTINCGNSSAFYTAQGSVGLWVKPLRANNDVFGESFLMFGEDVNNLLTINWTWEAGVVSRLRVQNRWNTEATPFRWRGEPATNYSLGQWYFLMLTQDGIAPKLYLNGSLNFTVSTGNDLTAWTSAAPSAPTLRVVYNSGIRYPQCEVGLVIACNRGLTAGEIQQIYLATKWRYQ